MLTLIRVRQLLLAALITTVAALAVPGMASAAPLPPSVDPFYKYTGTTPLSSSGRLVIASRRAGGLAARTYQLHQL